MIKEPAALALLLRHVLKVFRFNNPIVTKCTDAGTKSPGQALALYLEGSQSHVCVPSHVVTYLSVRYLL